MKNDSYIEQCIGSLPPEKQSAARKAFKDFLEGAPDDSMLSRLLVVFEATAAYGQTIPREITTAVEKLFPALDTRLKQLTNAAAENDQRGSEKLLSLLQEQMPVMAKALAVDKQTAVIESLRVGIERLERGVRRMRHARLTTMLSAILLAAGAGIGGTIACFRTDYESGLRSRRYLERMAAHDVYTKLTTGHNGELILSVEGSRILRGSDWKRDEKGNVVGVELIYPQTQ